MRILSKSKTEFYCIIIFLTYTAVRDRDRHQHSDDYSGMKIFPPFSGIELGVAHQVPKRPTGMFRPFSL